MVGRVGRSSLIASKVLSEVERNVSIWERGWRMKLLVFKTGNSANTQYAARHQYLLL